MYKIINEKEKVTGIEKNRVNLIVSDVEDVYIRLVLYGIIESHDNTKIEYVRIGNSNNLLNKYISNINTNLNNFKAGIIYSPSYTIGMVGQVLVDTFKKSQEEDRHYTVVIDTLNIIEDARGIYPFNSQNIMMLLADVFSKLENITLIMICKPTLPPVSYDGDMKTIYKYLEESIELEYDKLIKSGIHIDTCIYIPTLDSLPHDMYYYNIFDTEILDEIEFEDMLDKLNIDKEELYRLIVSYTYSAISINDDISHKRLSTLLDLIKLGKVKIPSETMDGFAEELSEKVALLRNDSLEGVAKSQKEILIEIRDSVNELNTNIKQLVQSIGFMNGAV